MSDYDPFSGRYVGEDGSEFKSTLYSKGLGLIDIIIEPHFDINNEMLNL